MWAQQYLIKRAVVVRPNLANLARLKRLEHALAEHSRIWGFSTFGDLARPRSRGARLSKLYKRLLARENPVGAFPRGIVE